MVLSLLPHLPYQNQKSYRQKVSRSYSSSSNTTRV